MLCTLQPASAHQVSVSTADTQSPLIELAPCFYQNTKWQDIAYLQVADTPTGDRKFVLQISQAGELKVSELIPLKAPEAESERGSQGNSGVGGAQSKSGRD
jgi:hypothetical protein